MTGDAAFVELLLAAGVTVSLVYHQDQSVDVGEQRRVEVEQVEQDLSFVGLGCGQGEGHRQAAHGGDQVQPQAPEPA